MGFGLGFSGNCGNQSAQIRRLASLPRIGRSGKGKKSRGRREKPSRVQVGGAHQQPMNHRHRARSQETKALLTNNQRDVSMYHPLAMRGLAPPPSRMRRSSLCLAEKAFLSTRFLPIYWTTTKLAISMKDDRERERERERCQGISGPLKFISSSRPAQKTSPRERRQTPRTCNWGLEMASLGQLSPAVNLARL